tara:strand:- start:24 stop:212 length:189 start_codon:yes stop_codon:yes gene_type:complete
MGKGDKKSKKGKRFMGSYGVVRPRKTDSPNIIPSEKKEASSTKKKTTSKKKKTVKSKTTTKS